MQDDLFGFRSWFKSVVFARFLDISPTHCDSCSSLYQTGNVRVLGLPSMLTLWQTCSTSGGSLERGSSENPAFSTEGTMSKTSAGSDGSSATSSLSTIRLLLTFSTPKML